MIEFKPPKNVDACLFKSDTSSFNYITQGAPVEGYCILKPDMTLTLYISPLEVFESDKFIVKSLKEFKDDLENFSCLGLCFEDFSLDWKSRFEKIELFDIGNNLKDIRIKKNIKERQLISLACKETVKCFNDLVRNWDFVSELGAVRFIKEYAARNDLQLAFEPIVASGANSAIAHHRPSDKLFKGFCVIDFGFSYKGYCADMTRTVYLGIPSIDEKAFYEKVLKVQGECLNGVQAGVKAMDLHNKAVKIFGEDASNFIHSLGHGIGLEVHELPRIHAKSEDLIQEFSCLTIEPGLYINGKHGVRIEDTVLALEDKECRVLTDANRELITLN